jgi:hypothetical protein
MAIDPHSPLFNVPELGGKYLQHETDKEKMIAERGWLGNFWGSSSSIPHNIAGLLLIVSLFSGVFYTCYACTKTTSEMGISIKDFWAIVSPFITLALGYLFGIKKKD